MEQIKSDVEKKGDIGIVAEVGNLNRFSWDYQ